MEKIQPIPKATEASIRSGQRKQELLKAFLMDKKSFVLSGEDIARFPMLATKIVDGNIDERGRAIRSNNESNKEEIESDPVYHLANTYERQKILARGMGETEYVQLLKSDERISPMDGVSESFAEFIEKFGEYAFETMCVSIFPKSSIFTPDMIRKLLAGDETVQNQMAIYCRERFGPRAVVSLTIRQFNSLEPDALMYVLDLLSGPLPGQRVDIFTGGSKIALIGDSVERGLFNDLLAEMETRRELREMREEDRFQKDQERARHQIETGSVIREMAIDGDLQGLFGAFSTSYPHNISPESYPEYETLFALVKKPPISRAIRTHWGPYGRVIDKKQIKAYKILSNDELKCRFQLVLTGNAASYFQGDITTDELIEKMGKLGIAVLSASDEKVEMDYLGTKHTVFSKSLEKKFWSIIKRLNDIRIKMAAKLRSFYLSESKKIDA